MNLLKTATIFDDVQVGDDVYYCGETYKVTFVDDGKVTITIPGHNANTWYNPYPSPWLTMPTSHTLKIGNPLLMIWS
jgi:hypothetical protein